MMEHLLARIKTSWEEMSPGLSEMRARMEISWEELKALMDINLEKVKAS
jgi:hypothetical protein